MIGRLQEALTAARQDVVGGLASGMLEEGFLGVTGEPLAGKSTLVRTAAAQLTHQQAARVVQVEVQGAYSVPKLAARWRHALLRAVVGGVAASHAAGLPREMWPASTVSAMLHAREALGDAYDSALSDQPAKGDRTSSFEQVIELTVRVARSGRCVLVLDHVDAPLLTYKHPIDPADLLWQVRAEAQHTSNLNVTVVCGRDAAESQVAGPEGAFYGDGRWTTISRPSLSQWLVAARAADVTLDEEAIDLAAGHVPTAFQLLRLMSERDCDAREAFRLAARTQHEHAARSLQHATSLHRLGAHVLVSIANGYGPYAATPDAKSGDVARAVRQLVLAGLVRRDPNDARGWLLVDPLVQWLLAEAMNVRPEEPLPEMRKERARE